MVYFKDTYNIAQRTYAYKMYIVKNWKQVPTIIILL
jgi:hypothetical protein